MHGVIGRSARPTLDSSFFQGGALTPAALMGAPAEAFRGAMQFSANLSDLVFNRNPLFAHTQLAKWGRAQTEATRLFSAEHQRPQFGIDAVTIGNEAIKIELQTLVERPFSSLKRFKRDMPEGDPKVLIVPPMSGHYPTLLRGTVATMVEGHDVYILDWNNIRDVPLSEGTFNLSSFINEIVWALQTIGEGAHVFAVCQPVPATLAAVAMMAEDGDPCTPRSMTLLAGPVDTRINPTKVNELATNKPIKWFEDNVISQVPSRYLGSGRFVYPGALQLSGFMMMNPERHAKAFQNMVSHLAEGSNEKANTIRRFYEEYLAVMDLSASFYLETIRDVFQQHSLPQGTFTCTDAHGQLRIPNLKAITQTALMTVEGERDDICGLGQTEAAHELCSNIPLSRKLHHPEPEAGHYGVFNGQRWTRRIYPRVKRFIRANDVKPRLGLH